jgi:oxaloacetate decarboxylase gamma subunit
MDWQLFEEAFWVMLLGMGIVFSFLTLLVLLMYGSQWLFNRFEPTPAPSPAFPPTGGEIDPALLAAVASAVHRFRSPR